MFWNTKKNNNKSLPDNVKGFDLYINEEKQATINIIKLNLKKRKTDKEILQSALLIGLSLMEETVTHQATFYKKVDEVLHEFRIDS